MPAPPIDQDSKHDTLELCQIPSNSERLVLTIYGAEQQLLLRAIHGEQTTRDFFSSDRPGDLAMVKLKSVRR